MFGCSPMSILFTTADGPTYVDRDGHANYKCRRITSMATSSYVPDVASSCLDCTTLANVAVYISVQIRSFRRVETHHITLRHKSIYVYVVFALQASV